MKFLKTDIFGAYIIDLNPHEDRRGKFMRTFCHKQFKAQGLCSDFVQSNFSMTKRKGTVRGLHLQTHPYSEIKLIHCVRGAICDVIVDMRRNSPSFMKHLMVELTEDNFKMLYVPEGLAHGFQTLSDGVGINYQHSTYYQPAAELGVPYNDPLIGIEWPLEVTEISEKDQSHPPLGREFSGLSVNNKDHR